MRAGHGQSRPRRSSRWRWPSSINFAVIGLGTGAMTCRSQPGDTVTYYELDPDIVRIARDPKLFNFLSECRPDTKIIVGDARLTLVDAPDGSYDLIFVDAFIGKSD